jgi:hypothetical protein
VAPGRDRSGHRSAWLVLLSASAAAVFVVAVAVGLARRDREALAFAAVIPVTVGLAQVGEGRVGRVLLTLVFVDVGVWMLPAAVSNLAHREAPAQVLVPVILVALSAAGLVASAGAEL